MTPKHFCVYMYGLLLIKMLNSLPYNKRSVQTTEIKTLDKLTKVIRERRLLDLAKTDTTILKSVLKSSSNTSLRELHYKNNRDLMQEDLTVRQKETGDVILSKVTAPVNAEGSKIESFYVVLRNRSVKHLKKADLNTQKRSLHGFWYG